VLQSVGPIRGLITAPTYRVVNINIILSTVPPLKQSEAA